MPAAHNAALRHRPCDRLVPAGFAFAAVRAPPSCGPAQPTQALPLRAQRPLSGPPASTCLSPDLGAEHAQPRCLDQDSAVLEPVYRGYRSALAQLQYGASGDLPVAHGRECRARLLERKDCRRRRLQLSLLVKTEDLGEAGGDLLRVPLAVVADLQPADLDVLQQ